ncbi:glycoside hydrolase family protein [Hoeflea sp.]|uniref:glycoside hydrolase family protein n=1 Tax=Hoeflea sp. TaxID=1940281 RepID=UPI003BAF3C9C
MPAYDPRLIPFTGGHEGKVLRAYRDPVGVITIGYGFTWGSKVFREWWLKKHGRKLQLGDRIAEADSSAVLKKLIDAEYYGPVRKHASRATPHAQAAATDMLFNCGLGAAKWTWFKALVRGDVREAARRLKVTATTAKGRRLPGLVRRRAEASAIMEFNKWPAWVKAPRSSAASDIAVSMPAWRLGEDDFNQGVRWLVDLGYLSDKAANRDLVEAAVRRFQEAHPQLDNDGILGRSTLDQIQRVIDVRAKAAKGAASSGAGAATGAADRSISATGYGDLILYGSLAVLVIGGIWLAWRYRDELAIAVRGAGSLKMGGRA